MSAYRLRVATAGDVAAVLRHRRRMFEAMGYTDAAALDAMNAASTPLLKRGFAEGSYRGWLVETDRGEVVAGGGVIVLEFQAHPIDPRPRRAFVVNMYTEPEHRKRGLARLVMEAIVAWCRADGMATLYLHASDDARPLYASLGFVATNEMRLDLKRPS